MDTLNMGTISYVVTKKFPDSKDKSRAIFDWIAYNISFDVKAARSNGNEKSSSDIILKTQLAYCYFHHTLAYLVKAVIPM